MKILCQDLIVRYRFNVYLILSCTKLRFFFFLLLCWPTNVFEFWIRCYGCKVVLFLPKVNSIISYTIPNLTCVPTPFFKQSTKASRLVDRFVNMTSLKWTDCHITYATTKFKIICINCCKNTPTSIYVLLCRYVLSCRYCWL